jgi:GYF domain 2
MTKYFIHLNGQQVGPLTLDEVKQHGITRSTQVWHEGLTGWVAAANIESLATVFSTPPPLEPAAVPAGAVPPPYQEPAHYQPEPVEYEKPSRYFLGLPVLNWYLAGGFIAAAVLFFTFENYSGGQSVHVQEQITNAEQNELLQQQQAQLDAQQAQIEEQKRIEQERIAREQEAAKQQRIAQLRKELTAARNNYAKAVEYRASVNEFTLGRSRSKKERQMAAASAKIAQWEAETIRITNELGALDAQ